MKRIKEKRILLKKRNEKELNKEGKGRKIEKI